MKKFSGIVLFLGVVVAVGSTLGVVTVAHAAKAPAGKTFFVVSLGMATDASEAYQVDVGCLSFTRTQICDDAGAGDCGEWWGTDEGVRTRKQRSLAFEFTLIDDETGMLVEMDGTGRIDTRGPRSSIAGVARAMEPNSGVDINVAFAGRAVGSEKCRRLVDEFEAENN